MRILLCFSFLLIFALSGNGQERYKLAKYPDLEEGISVHDILLLNEGKVYIATDLGLYFISSFEDIPKIIIRNREITALCESEDNSFFFGGGNMFGNSRNFEMHYLKDPTVSITCMADYANSIWIGTDKGLYEIKKRNYSTIKHFTTKNSKLKSPKINFLYSDNHGVLWVGSNKGVVRISDDSWKSYENQSMEGIYENREGLWLLSDEELWNIDNVDQYNRWYRADLQDGLKKGRVNDIAVDSEDRIIIASEVIVRFDPYSGNIEKYGKDLGLISSTCLALEIDDNDKLWIGTENDGLYTVGFKSRKRKLQKTYEPMEFTLSSRGPSCSGEDDGSVKLKLKGGKTPYKISWSNGEKDVRQISGLSAGQYRVTVSDILNDTLESRVLLIEPRELSIVLQELNVDEFGEGNSSAFFVFDGGSPGYILDIDGINSTNPALDISSGKHIATVTDINGCKASIDFEIEGDKDLSQLDASSIQVGQVVRIDKLYFTTDSTSINNDAIPVLDDVFTFLTNNPKIIIEIGGHTNGLPPHDYCDKLSKNRAKNVAEHLVDRGIPVNRISYRGYGKRQPIATNKTTAGRKRNQRVEIKILSLGN